jgi:hypothetical protein
MCDYSLETVDQRKARSDEMLVTARIGEHKTMGLISPKKPDTAVCLVAGMRARINVTPSMSRDFKIPAGPAMATFTQRELPSDTDDYRDGFVFDDAPDEQRLLHDFDVDVAIIPVGLDVSAELKRELVDA